MALIVLIKVTGLPIHDSLTKGQMMTSSPYTFPQIVLAHLRGYAGVLGEITLILVTQLRAKTLLVIVVPTAQTVC